MRFSVLLPDGRRLGFYRPTVTVVDGLEAVALWQTAPDEWTLDGTPVTEGKAVALMAEARKARHVQAG